MHFTIYNDIRSSTEDEPLKVVEAARNFRLPDQHTKTTPTVASLTERLQNPPQKNNIQCPYRSTSGIIRACFHFSDANLTRRGGVEADEWCIRVAWDDNIRSSWNRGSGIPLSPFWFLFASFGLGPAFCSVLTTIRVTL